MPDSTPTNRQSNPWMLGLTLLWVGLLGLALLLCFVGASARNVHGDAAAASIDLLAAGVAVGLALVVIAIQLGVAALRWYLDESSRPVPVAQEARPYVRQDF